MNAQVGEITAEVSPEEVERRIAEYRRVSFQRQLPAQVVYPGPKALCPWPDCGMPIAGIVFHLDKMGAPDQVRRWLASWWNGPGLVGRCPRCTQYVQFDVTEKRIVSDPTDLISALLPEDWNQKAHIVTKSA